MTKIKFLSLYLVLMFLFNCDFQSPGPVLSENEEPQEPNVPVKDGWGIVRLRITDSQNVSARTALPNTPVFTSYRLSFTALGGQGEKADIVFSASGNAVIEDIELEVGPWTVKAFGRVMFNDDEEEIAEGSAAVNVVAGKRIEISIVIRINEEKRGEGFFEWKLIIPEGIPARTYSVSLADWENETRRVLEFDGTVDIHHDGDVIVSGSSLLENGFYIVKITVGTERQTSIYPEVVHIRASETTSYIHLVSPDAFVDVVILDGTAEVSLTLNGEIIPPHVVELNEIRAYSPAGEIAYAKIDGNRWEMRLVQFSFSTDVGFSLIVSFFDNRLELKSDVIKNVYHDDVGGINVAVNYALMSIEGVLEPHTVSDIQDSGWDIFVCSDSDNIKGSTLAVNTPVKTGPGGHFSLIIPAFETLTDIYFRVEKKIQGKLYRRDGLNKLSAGNSRITAVTLHACFVYPDNVLINGNEAMIPLKSGDRLINNGCFTFTKVNLNSYTTYSFSLSANFSCNTVLGGSNTIYGFSNVILSPAGINYFDNNDTIAFYNGKPDDRRLPGQDNILIQIDFRGDEYLASGKPALKIKKTEEVLIVPGTFVRGSPDTERGREGPSGKSSETQGTVTISQALYVMPYEVSQKEYGSLMPAPGYKDIKFKNDNFPAVYASWWDAVEYCNRLSLKEGFTPVYTITGTGSNKSVSADWDAKGYRLPTEAEWEYACRAGTTTTFYFGDTLTTDLANYNGAAVDTYGYNPVPGVYRGCLIEVGRFAPNAWGLYDIHGNAWEMCWDYYGDYPPGTQVDPRGPQTGTSEINGTDAAAKDSMNKRIIRGGSYFNQPRYLRAGHRGVIAPDDRSYNDIGFRVVRNF